MVFQKPSVALHLIFPPSLQSIIGDRMKVSIRPFGQFVRRNPLPDLGFAARGLKNLPDRALADSALFRIPDTPVKKPFELL